MQDPRNIFVDQRSGYQTPQSNEQPSSNPQADATIQTPPNSQGTRANGTPTESEYQQKIAQMQALAQKYQREGEGQLVKDIVNSVIEQKARGQLTNDQLLAFAKRVTPLLNAEQRQRLNSLVEQLIKL